MRLNGVERVDHHEGSGSLGRTLAGHDDVDTRSHTLGQAGGPLVMKREDDVRPALQVEPHILGQVQPGGVLGPHVQHLLLGEAVRSVLVFGMRNWVFSTNPNILGSNTCSQILYFIHLLPHR